MYGFYRIAVIVPELKVADVSFNTAEIIRCIKEAEKQGASAALFPELSITGASCGDLFFQKNLLDAAENSLFRIADAFRDSSLLIALGLPLIRENRLYNCAALLQKGRILSLTPKTFLSNLSAETRYFTDGRFLLKNALSFMTGRKTETEAETGIPFTDQIQITGSGIKVGIRFGQNLQESGSGLQNGLVLNLAASAAIAGQRKILRENLKVQSRKNMNIQLYASAGVHESTTDGVYDGVAMVAENGELLAENQAFQRKSDILYAEVDLDAVSNLARQRLTAGTEDAEMEEQTGIPSSVVSLEPADRLQYRKIDCLPFLPSPEDADEVCREIFQIQSAALAKRLDVTGSKKTVIGVSGGLDSTLALLVLRETYALLNRDPHDIIAVSMPGFGTTSRTRGNSMNLSDLLNTDARTVDICPACLQHFRDIGHDPAVLDVTYENVQARERTQILMDIANRERGLVVGTGDLSEIALGWSTYNGDHMSMYAVNGGIPKTLIRYLVSWYAGQYPGELGQVLQDIVDTPVSPELLPADASGKIAQKTESILGAYELHDFYLYHFVRYAASPDKLFFLAKRAFNGKYPDAEILRTLKLFLQRFFTQQFKRSCMPDGPQTGIIGLSPRGGWCMPSDASMQLWLSTLENGEKQN